MFGKSYETLTNGLTNLIEELSQKGKLREEKIKTKISELEKEVQVIKDEISVQTQLLVDAEIEENEKDQELIGKSLDKLRIKLDETEMKLSSYKTTMAAPGISQSEAEKLRTAVLKVRQERKSKLAEIVSSREKAYRQIKELNEEIKKLDDLRNTFSAEKETYIAKPAMQYIHPEFGKEIYQIQLGTYQYVFNDWMDGRKID